MSQLPDLRFLLSITSENAGSDLLVTLVDADHATHPGVPGISSTAPLAVRREVARSRARMFPDRPDLIIEAGGHVVAVVEVKLLTGLGDSAALRIRGRDEGHEVDRRLS